MSALTPPTGWSVSDAGLQKTFTFSGFPEAVAFTVEIGKLAETANHHPDLDIRWNKVHVTLITHDAGDTVTEKDTALAEQANQIGDDVINAQAKALFE